MNTPLSAPIVKNRMIAADFFLPESKMDIANPSNLFFKERKKMLKMTKI
jgi:hypothetical protein